MARVQTMVQLSDDLIAELDRRARHDGVSRSQVIRHAVEAFLASDREVELDRQIVEGYRRMPQGGELDQDEWGDLGGFVAALADDTFRRLAEEESEAGHEPW